LNIYKEQINVDNREKDEELQGVEIITTTLDNNDNVSKQTTMVCSVSNEQEVKDCVLSKFNG